MVRKRETKICESNMTHLNSCRSNELPISFTGTRQPSDDISSSTIFPTLNGISDTEDQKPSMFCEEILKGLFGYNSTITLHHLKVNNPESRAFLQYAQGKKPEQMIQEQFADSAHKKVEMRASPETQVGECLPLTQCPRWKLFRARIRAYRAICKFSILLPVAHVVRVSKKRVKQSFLNYFITINIIRFYLHLFKPLILKALQWVPFKVNQFNKLNSYFVKFRGCR